MKKSTLIVSVMAMCAVAGLSVAGEPKPVTGTNPGSTMSKPQMLPPRTTQTTPVTSTNTTVPNMGAPGSILNTAATNGSFNTFVKAVEITGLNKEFAGQGPWTVFAPTDEAFAKLGQEKLEKIMLPENRNLLKSVLLYHVVKGNWMNSQFATMTGATTMNGQRVMILAKNGTMIDNATITTPDIKCTNGMIQVVNTVMWPETKNVLEVAQSTGKFNTFWKAIEAAGLSSTLESDGPFTIFAPTDAAFAALPAGTLENLMKPENKAQLVSLLSYHVIPSRVFTTDTMNTNTFKTVQGTDVKFSNVNNTFMVNNAKITMTDIDASNGVIQVIDTVIMPASH